MQSLDILNLESTLVSSKTGIIRNLGRLRNDEFEPELPYVFGLSLSNFNYTEDEFPFQTCSGKGLTIGQAKRSALGEAVERYCASQYSEDKIIISSFDSLDKAVNPADLVLYSQEQYRAHSFKFARFSRDANLGWVEGVSLLSNNRMFVPAVGVYLYYTPITHDDHLFSGTSNGLACGNTREMALKNALLEVIERDAFLITWFCKLPMPKIELDSISNLSTKRLIEGYERRGVKVHVNALMLDTKIPTFMATAIDTSENGPSAVVGLSADPNVEAGILKSILEIGQLRPHLKRQMRASSYIESMKKFESLENVKTIEDHELFYTSHKTLSCFDFLLNNNNCIELEQLPNHIADDAGQLQYCIESVSKTGSDIIFIDLSTPDISELGLSTVRVIVTEFQPIHFGYNEERLGGKRLFEIPYKLGYAPKTLKAEDLNSFPHPLG
jgi:ribosomal protein S12 methylthiotransferase accessory factor